MKHYKSKIKQHPPNPLQRGTKSKILLLGFVLVTCMLVTSCFYTHQTTGDTYVLHTDYEAFLVEDRPDNPVSNYIGYCFLPVNDPEDENVKDSLEILTYFLSNHGYKQIIKEEMLANPDIIPKTFMLGFGHHSSFSHDTIQVQINLYYLDVEKKKNQMFWSWQAKFDGYPLCRSTLEPALNDIFFKEPLGKSKQPLLPKMSAQSNTYEKFMIDLAKARMKLQKKK